MSMVSLLVNPLATADQLAASPSQSDGVPSDMETSLRWAASTLIQSAGILLRLPQPTIATATVLLQRFYLVASMRSFPVLATAHAAIYLAAKLTERPTKPRHIVNATTCLLKSATPSPISPPRPPAGRAADRDARIRGDDEDDGGAEDDDGNGPEDGERAAEAYYVDEHTYLHHRTRLLDTETEILRALGFQTHTALPYTLVINYAQTLDCLAKPLLKRSFGYLSDALLSPSLVFLTHHPHALAVAALHLAARDEGLGLPKAWWEIFDVDREDLDFLAAVMAGVGDFVGGQVRAWGRGRAAIPWEGRELEEELERRRREQTDV